MDNIEYIKQENDFWEEMKKKVIAYYDEELRQVKDEYEKANDPFLGYIDIVNLEKCREKLKRAKCQSS